MSGSNGKSGNKVRTVIKYATTAATVSFVLYKLYDSFYNKIEEVWNEDSSTENFAETLTISQFDEIIKTINKPLLDDLKQIKRQIKKTDDDSLKMKLWTVLSEKTIVLLINLLLANKVINLVINDLNASTENKKIIIYTYLKENAQNQLSILNNSIRLHQDEDTDVVIMKEMNFNTFNIIIKQMILDNNLDNVSMFLNFNFKVLSESMKELDYDANVENIALEKNVISVQNDILQILFNNNTVENNLNLADYLDDFNKSAETFNLSDGKFAKFITVLIKELDQKLGQ
ncbi:hypothetical protein QEN19_001156 [Hanseniaspora menglaensis]